MSNVQVGIRMFLVNRFDKTSFVCLFQGWDRGTRANPGPPTPFAWWTCRFLKSSLIVVSPLYETSFIICVKIKRKYQSMWGSLSLEALDHIKNIFYVLTQFKLASQGHCLTCNFYHEVHVVRWPYIRICIYLECWLSRFKMVGDSVCQKYIIFELIWQHLVNCLCTYWDLAWWILLILLHIKYVMAKRQGM